MSDASRIFVEVQMAVTRAEHNTLAEVEKMCHGKKYAALRKKLARWKEGLRSQLRGQARRIQNERGGDTQNDATR